MVDIVNAVDDNRESELNRALELLHFAFRVVIAEPDRILGRKGMGRAHHRILYFLAQRPEISMTELIRILSITRQALHRPLGDLLREKYVVSRPSEQNRRQSILLLTTKGKALEERISGLQRKAFEEAFSSFGPTAERHWRNIMEHLATSSDDA